MKRTLLLLFFGIFLLGNTSFAQRNCGSMDHHQHLMETSPEYKKNIENLEKYTRDFTMQNRELNNGVVTIPVIVHVVYNTSQQNISDAQIMSQIDVLNEDFRRLNSDQSNTPPLFDPVAADTEIEFCLTEITRTFTTVSNHGTNNSVKYTSQGGKDVVSPDQMMNIWICSIGGGILGYAQFPGGPAATDGIVLDYRYTGTTGTATYPFHLGRTGTHEVGHWLNLRHIWGDGGCNVDDSVSDTPLAGGPNYTGNPCTFPGPNSCKPKGKPGQPDDPDMFMNYMDYSDDECMNMYTLGQKTRMWAALNGARSSFLAAACDGTPPPPVEICDNGIDDDGDSLVDCDDPDCTFDSNCIDPGSCEVPTNLTHTSQKGGKEALLQWNAAAGAVGYYVEVYDDKGNLFASGTVTSNGAILSGTTKGAYYTWQVRSNCQATVSDWAYSSFFARLDGNTDDNWHELSIIPNPATDQVQITWDLSANASIKSVDSGEITELNSTTIIQFISMNGAVVQQQQFINTYQCNLYVTDLPQGVYLLRASNDAGKTATKKFIKL